jgi:uncharacterized membrane protein HdeD (DUF308 family)
MLRRHMNTVRMPNNLGILLLAVWLILTGIIPLFDLTFSGLSLVMAILAIVTGVLLILNR